VIEARYMSTHAIKAELVSLLQELVPEKVWYRRSGIVEMSEFAVHELDAESDDPRVQRALELAHVMYDHERSSK
jgi:hypothetical protein